MFIVIREKHITFTYDSRQSVIGIYHDKAVAEAKAKELYDKAYRKQHDGYSYSYFVLEGQIKG